MGLAVVVIILLLHDDISGILHVISGACATNERFLFHQKRTAVHQR